MATFTRVITDPIGLSDGRQQFVYWLPPLGFVQQAPRPATDPRYLLTGYSVAKGLLYTFKGIARKWTFTVSGIANKVCTSCASFNGSWTIKYDQSTWTWHSTAQGNPCYGDYPCWRMYGLFWPMTPVMHLEITNYALPSAGCYPAGQQQDAWEIPISKFNPTGTNVMVQTVDSRACRNCDASTVGNITITPVFS